jgi:hypothetical protein
MRKKVVAHVFLVVRRGLDVHQRARQFEQVHSGLFCPCFFEEAKRKEGTAKEMRSGLPPLDSASSAQPKRPQQNYGRQWTGLRPAPQPRASQLSRRFRRTTYQLTKLPSASPAEGAPFAQASEADRNYARLLLASAPLPRPLQFRGLLAKKRTIFQILSMQKIVSAPPVVKGRGKKACAAK